MLSAPGVWAPIRGHRAKAFTSSASRSSGRGDHAAANYFRGRHCINNYEQDPRTRRSACRDRAQHSTGARRREAAHDPGLQDLSLTNSLLDRDFEGFAGSPQGFIEQYGEGGVVLVTDREGRRGFPRSRLDGASLPPRNNRALWIRCSPLRRLFYSNLFISTVKNQLIVTSRSRSFATAKSFSIFRSARRSRYSRPSSNSNACKPGFWTISIFDSEGVNFARVPIGSPHASASVHRLRFMPRCSACRKRPSRRCHLKACR